MLNVKSYLGGVFERLLVFNFLVLFLHNPSPLSTLLFAGSVDKQDAKPRLEKTSNITFTHDPTTEYP